jgi:hypothetical protein
MPKKKSSRPAASLGSNQNEEPKSASQIRREKITRAGAIVIVLALLLSLLAGAFSVAPAQAAETSNFAGFSKSVQIAQVTSEIVDTDGDGIENNEDPDVDGDGLVNGEDSDIDGDGIENFEDADPIDTTDIDSKSPEKPSRPGTAGDILTGESSWFWTLAPIGLIAVISLILLAKHRNNRP